MTAPAYHLHVDPDSEGTNPGVTVFARVPWGIARPASGVPSLMERNVIVRLETADMASGGFKASPPGPEDVLRVLLVFAEAPGSRPLAMRLEREGLLDLFERRILPKRQVHVDVLCHGVTAAPCAAGGGPGPFAQRLGEKEGARARRCGPCHAAPLRQRRRRLRDPPRT